MYKPKTKHDARILRTLRGDVEMTPEDIAAADAYMLREKAKVLAARTRLHNDYQTTGVDGPRVVRLPFHLD